MKNFAVSVIPEGDEGNVPVALAGQVMVDVQRILGDIGEYLVAKELRIQKSLHPDLLTRFVLFLNETGGISLGSSTIAPQTEGYGNIVDDAVTLMEETLDALGSGIGGYWMEDHFNDPIYRNQIIYDIMALYRHLNAYSGYSLLYGADGSKKLGTVNVEKLEAFIKNKGFTANGATLGIISISQSKSRHDSVSLICGDDKTKLYFADKASETATKAYAGQPVIIGGKMSFSKDGNLLEIRDAGGVTPVSSIKFRRMISGDGDVTLKSPVVATISYDNGIWSLKNEDLGISVSKETWDEAVQSFHDYFIFLWIQYADPEAEISEEETEVRDYLLSLVA